MAAAAAGAREHLRPASASPVTAAARARLHRRRPAATPSPVLPPDEDTRRPRRRRPGGARPARARPRPRAPTTPSSTFAGIGMPRSSKVATPALPRRVWITFQKKSACAAASRNTNASEIRVSVSYCDGSTDQRRGAPSRPWTSQRPKKIMPDDERRPHVDPGELLAVERLAAELGQQGVRGAEDQQADVQHRHVVEVADDPERVVDGDVERDRGVDDAREPGEEPADEAEEERRRRGRPAEPRAVDREREAVERERRGQHEREGDRLHGRVDLRLRACRSDSRGRGGAPRRRRSRSRRPSRRSAITWPATRSRPA